MNTIKGTDELFAFHIYSKGRAIELKNELIKQPGRRVIFDGSKILCKEQVVSAILRANRAEINNTMMAKKWNVEVLLQVAATHQIKQAISLLDITEITEIIFIVQSSDEIPIKGMLSGFPEIFPDENIIRMYNIRNKSNSCLEIISRAAKVIVNHT